MNTTAGTCLVTGATGFIGRTVIDRLVAAGWNVRALHRGTSEISAETGVHWVNADLNNIDLLEESMQDEDVVIHLAGVGSPSWGIDQAELLFHTNVVGTLNVVEAAKRTGVKRIVSTSSASIYGNVDSDAIDETTVPAPSTSYGLSKLAQEDALKLASRTSGIETVSLRLFNVYGPGEDMSDSNRKLIPTIARNIRAGNAITVFGDGRQTRDFVHVDDVAEAIVTSASVPLSTSDVINIGTGVGTSILEVIETVAANLQTVANLQYKPARPGEVQHSVADSGKAARFGITSKVRFAEGISTVFSPTASGKRLL